MSNESECPEQPSTSLIEGHPMRCGRTSLVEPRSRTALEQLTSSLIQLVEDDILPTVSADHDLATEDAAHVVISALLSTTVNVGVRLMGIEPAIVQERLINSLSHPAILVGGCSAHDGCKSEDSSSASPLSTWRDAPQISPYASDATSHRCLAVLDYMLSELHTGRVPDLATVRDTMSMRRDLDSRGCVAVRGRD